MDNYEGVANNFKSYFGEQHIKAQFAEKANAGEVARAMELKASKTEFNQLSSAIEALHDRLKQMSILQSEIAKSVLPTKASGSFNAKENINTKMKRREFVA